VILEMSVVVDEVVGVEVMKTVAVLAVLKVVVVDVVVMVLC
jgi:hypothetical protein